MKKLDFIFILLMLSVGKLYGQSIFSGHIKDRDNMPVTGANVMLKKDGSILTFGRSDTLGNYTLKAKLSAGIYDVDITRLGYIKSTAVIIVDDSTQNSISLDFVLEDASLELNEVEVSGKRLPVIVKKDTVIYHVGSYSDAYDRSLEDVMRKFPGFKINPDGSIEVNGKAVKKVVIEGKEVSDFGAAVLTKNIPADMVDNIEVRFDEKSEKLKESLLDDNKFVVLDIKLKSDLKKSFFGSAELGAGIGESPEIGGYSNVFSLKEKMNLQMFGEMSHLGTPRINIRHIKNIGEEAIGKLFALPADLNEIKNSGRLTDEIYGFKNFTDTDNAIVGFSANIPLSRSLDLYMGSFNTYDFLEKERLSSQTVFSETVNAFSLSENQSQYYSKNKLQAKFTESNLKINTDINYVLSNSKLKNTGYERISGFGFNFRKHHKSNSFYVNNALEYLLNPSLGLIFKSSFSNETFPIRLFTDNATLQQTTGLEEAFTQINHNKEQSFINELKIHTKSNFGNHEVGVKNWYDKLSNYKESDASGFSAVAHDVKFNIKSLVYDYSYFAGFFSANIKNEFSNISFPNKEAGAANKFYYQVNSAFGFNLDGWGNIQLTYTRNVDRVPLQKIVNGKTLRDFQTIWIPAEQITPRLNHLVAFTYNFGKPTSSFGFETALLKGYNQNLDNADFDNLVIIQGAQMRTDFTLLSTAFKWNPSDKFPVRIKLSPEHISQNSYYIIRSEEVKNTSNTYMLSLDMFTSFKRNFNTGVVSKYSYLDFYGTRLNQNFSFFNNSLFGKYKGLKGYLLLEANFRVVNFINTPMKSFNQADLRVTFNKKKYQIYAHAVNLFDSRSFLTQDLSNNILNRDENAVLGRYIWVGCSFKFR